MLTNKEIPPTAGLPMIWRDFLPQHANLTQLLTQHLALPNPQLTCSGTAALIVILLTLSKKSTRKNVIIPAYTCPLVSIAIHYCGLNVQLCDLASNHFDFDFTQLSDLVDDNTLAIIPTHIGGRIVDVSAAAQIADKVGAYVIEDAAQSLGATMGNKAVGLRGDAGFFSLAVGKGLTTFEGGVLVSKHPHLQKEFNILGRDLLKNNRWREFQRSIQLCAYFALYRPHTLTYAYGMPFRKSVNRNDWINAVGDYFSTNIPLHTLGRWRQKRAGHALERLPELLRLTQLQALTRVEKLKAINGLHVYTDPHHKNSPHEARGIWPVIMVSLPSQSLRDKALKLLIPMQLGVSRMFIDSIGNYDYLKIRLAKSLMSNFPTSNANSFAARTLTISNSLWLSDEQFSKIIVGLTTILS